MNLIQDGKCEFHAGGFALLVFSLFSLTAHWVKEYTNSYSQSVRETAGGCGMELPNKCMCYVHSQASVCSLAPTESADLTPVDSTPDS